MIEIKELQKDFGSTKALDSVSLSVPDGSVFGLVGSNGAGKSTLLRVLAGIYQADGGTVSIDGEAPFENLKVKDNIAFVSDYPFFYSGATVDSMAHYYRLAYSRWDDKRFENLKSVFPISSKQKISSMSKGMQRQAAIILALSHAPKYILFDEIFDGLDPVIRELVKKILIEYISVMNATVVIASHNLRELEGFCDHIGLLHRGGVLLEKDIDSDSAGVYRVQFVMESEDFEQIRPELRIVNETHQGKMIQLTVKGDEEQIRQTIESKSPVFFEALPLTLEELFISEMEVAGYEISKLFS